MRKYGDILIILNMGSEGLVLNLINWRHYLAIQSHLFLFCAT